MVEKQRARYVGGAEGAPPLPPPGGYQGARRAPSGALPTLGRPAMVTYTAPEEKRSAGPFAIVALSVAASFVLVLLIAMAVGGADALYGATMLVLQLLVVGVVVAALVTRHGRMLGAIALAVTLVFNVATVGAMGALRAAATHAYDGTKSTEQKHAEAYPGVDRMSPSEILARPSLEEVQAQGERLMADVRARLTAEFGYTWVQSGTEDIGPERNGYGGESMLRRYVSTAWTTEQPVQDNAQKRRVAEVIDEVLVDHGMWSLYALHEPGVLGLAPEMLAKLYGSADPERAHTWEFYSDAYPDPLWFYTHMLDLSKDATGDFRVEREARQAQTGEPLEGIQLTIFARHLLSEADREEFSERIEDYPGF